MALLVGATYGIGFVFLFGTPIRDRPPLPPIRPHNVSDLTAVRNTAPVINVTQGNDKNQIENKHSFNSERSFSGPVNNSNISTSITYNLNFYFK